MNFDDDVGKIAEKLALLEKTLAEFDRTADGRNGNSETVNAEALKLIRGENRAAALTAIRSGLVDQIQDERSKIVKAIKQDRAPDLRVV